MVRWRGKEEGGQGAARARVSLCSMFCTYIRSHRGADSVQQL